MRIPIAHLLPLVTLGQVLAIASLAHAGGASPAAKRAALVEAHKAALEARFNQHAELSELLASPREPDPMRTALLRDHARFVPGATGVRIGEGHGTVVELRDEGMYVREGNREPRRADVADLVRAGIDSKRAFEEVISKRLREFAPAAAGRTVSVREAAALVAQLESHRDVKLLRDYHFQVVTPPGSPLADLPLGNVGVEAVGVSASCVRVVKQGYPRPVTYDDLVQLGITSKPELDAYLAKQIVKLAGVAGDSMDAGVAQAARAALKTQIKGASALIEVIEEPLKVAPDIAFLLKMRSAMSNRAVVIADDKAGAILEVRNTRVSGKFHSQELVLIVDARHPFGRIATPAELRRFGIRNQAAFKSAVSEALLGLADEDFPAAVAPLPSAS